MRLRPRFISRWHRWAKVSGHYLFGNGGAPLPLSHVSLELTYRCNHRCNMCFLYGDHLRPQNPVLDTIGRRRELSAAEWSLALEGIRETGTRSLVFTGGEAFLKEGLLGLLGQAKVLGFSVSLLSNGSRITEDAARELVRIGVDFVRFSLDGDRETHDEICGAPNYDLLMASVRRIVRAKESLAAAQPRLGFENVVQRRNQGRICSVVEAAHREGVGHVTVSNVYFAPQPGAAARSAGMQTRHVQRELYAVDAGALAEELARARALARRYGIDLRSRLGGCAEVQRLYHDPAFSYADKCLYPWLMCRINPYGDVIPCTGSSLAMGNIMEASLAEIWNGEAYLRFRRELRAAGLFGDCLKCNTLASEDARRWRWLPRLRGGVPT
ncbi:MAG: radical SAM protein [Elusimicrobia bacterium]|nr:radical SAM protein [Elusimicrobiota bacterium]